jgi:hypothetical protein
VSGPLLLPTWEQLATAKPQLVDTMRRYLQQVACVLRPGSVSGADLALRSFAAFLVETTPQVSDVGDVTRRHVEKYKPWLAARPGQNKPQVRPATIVHRLGTLRMFFLHIDECCCAPVCGSANTPRYPPTKSCRSAPRPGYTSMSASCATTATCRCTPTWWA